jgi:Zn-dependent peptidase ImmA (M78 family)
MSVSLIDLADCGSPEKLAIEIFKKEPGLVAPVPIEKLAMQLGITEIKELDSDGYQGGLITTDTKSKGVILVNKRLRPGRRRFTLGHELGHFLIPTHRPTGADRFLCSFEDMLANDRKAFDQRMRWEAEANRFASLILMPPHLFRKEVNAKRDADLKHIVDLADRYKVSKESAGRTYVDFRDDAVALLVTHNGRLLRSYRRQDDFPFISVRWGAEIPRGSLLLRKKHAISSVSEIEETDSGVWLDVTRGARPPTVFEQVHQQHDGYALVLLSIEDEEKDEEADDSNWNRRNTSQRR